MKKLIVVIMLMVSTLTFSNYVVEKRDEILQVMEYAEQLWESPNLEEGKSQAMSEIIGEIMVEIEYEMIDNGENYSRQEKKDLKLIFDTYKGIISRTYMELHKKNKKLYSNFL